jgi:hypothetical protein
MTPLEDELVAGMREHTAGLVPAPDLIDRAVRGNRRRTRHAAATGSLGVAAVLAVVVATLGSPPARGPSAASQPAPRMLTVAEVSSRVLATLATDDLEHAMITIGQGDIQSTEEFWYDSVTGNSRHHGVQVQRGGGLEDTWIIRHDGTATVTLVNHATRTWWTKVRSDDNNKTGSHAGYTPDELRDQLRDGVWQLVGDEQINGRAAVHLRQVSGSMTGDLWVDADTYRMVRRHLVKATPGQAITITLDFDWPARTPEALQPFAFTPPAGYTQIDPSAG